MPVADEITASLAPITPETRRLRNISLWLLPLVLGAALVAHSWETAMEWWRTSDLIERRVDQGQAVDYAGAEWRLLALTRMGERRDGSTIVLVELEAVVRDAEAFATLPCSIALTDREGRRWSPTFMLPSELRKVQRKTAIPENCGPVMLTRPQAGTRVEIGESFIVPADSVAEVKPVVSIAAGRPYYIRFE